MPSLNMRTVNLTLLVILGITGASGVGTFLIGSPDARWMFWIHRIASFAILPLLVWKVGIIFRSYRKRGIEGSTILSAIGGILFIATFAYGLLWATLGAGDGSLPLLGPATGVGIHVALALTFLPVLVMHAIQRWPLVRLRKPDFVSRRAAVRYVSLATAGLLFWQATETTTATAGWKGADRRFTGSQMNGELSGNDYPSVNWFSDPRPRIGPEEWRLRIAGLVEREITLTLDQLREYETDTWREILDCTGGWYTDQRWTGVPLATLLGDSGIDPNASSIVFHSRTGYRRRFSLDEVDNLLLAVEVSGEPLSRGHGYPVRLVAPGHRGYHWVKWVVGIELSDIPAWVQSPLPLQ